jgi:hypothetical protein
MKIFSGSWTAETPFGLLELQIMDDGSFHLGAHSGWIRAHGQGLEVAMAADGLVQERRYTLPSPQGDTWWVPLPESSGVLRFVRQTIGTSRNIDFASGLRLDVPPGWKVRPAPGAVSCYPSSASRRGLPAAAFVEIYETLLPMKDEDHLIRSMTAMLAERTGQSPDSRIDVREVAGHKTHLIRSEATLLTGERLQVQLWVTARRDHLLALAQANIEGDILIEDAAVTTILSSARWPKWTRDDAIFGTWTHVERRPSGPLTEVVERSIALAPDGQYKRLQISSLELPDSDGVQPSRPKEVKERTGQWYSREGEIMLSAGLRGYRVRKRGVDTKPSELSLDGIVWHRPQ